MTVDAAAASESTPTGVRVLVVDDDVVIADLEMPRAHGLDVIRKLKGRFGPPGAHPRDDWPRRRGRPTRWSPVRSLRRMSSLVANFVDIARFEVAAVKPMVAPTRVYQVLESVLEVSASSLGRGVTTSIDCKTDLMARFDPALVERVLHNLVGNAARYCNQGGTIVAARRWNDEESAEISVDQLRTADRRRHPIAAVRQVRARQGRQGRQAPGRA